MVATALTCSQTPMRKPLALARRAAHTSRSARSLPVVRSRKQQTEGPTSAHPKTLLSGVTKVTGAVALALLLAGSTPDMAEAARSGGRAGGSAGFSRSRAAPAPQRSAPSAPSPSVQNNYYGGGGGFSPFGFSPFGMGGYGYGGGAMVVGAPIGGGFILQMFLLTAAVSVVGAVIRGFQSRKEDDDSW